MGKEVWFVFVIVLLTVCVGIDSCPKGGCKEAECNRKCKGIGMNGGSCELNYRNSKLHCTCNKDSSNAAALEQAAPDCNSTTQDQILINCKEKLATLNATTCSYIRKHEATLLALAAKYNRTAKTQEEIQLCQSIPDGSNSTVEYDESECSWLKEKLAMIQAASIDTLNPNETRNYATYLIQWTNAKLICGKGVGKLFRNLERRYEAIGRLGDECKANITRQCKYSTPNNAGKGNGPIIPQTCALGYIKFPKETLQIDLWSFCVHYGLRQPLRTAEECNSAGPNQILINCTGQFISFNYSTCSLVLEGIGLDSAKRNHRLDRELELIKMCQTIRFGSNATIDFDDSDCPTIRKKLPLIQTANNNTLNWDKVSDYIYSLNHWNKEKSICGAAGISLKLAALQPRYNFLDKNRKECIANLAKQCKTASAKNRKVKVDIPSTCALGYLEYTKSLNDLFEFCGYYKFRPYTPEKQFKECCTKTAAGYTCKRVESTKQC